MSFLSLVYSPKIPHAKRGEGNTMKEIVEFVSMLTRDKTYATVNNPMQVPWPTKKRGGLRYIKDEQTLLRSD
jgi:hypothetical protein